MEAQARHGTRAPTKKRMRELESLEAHLEVLLQDAKELKLSFAESSCLVMEMGISLERSRERFPELFKEDYHPDVYLIKTTQVPRASASAVAFGMGLFSGKGNLGPQHHRAFAVTSESRASDIMLRFHDCCQNYKAFRKSQEPTVHKLKEPILDEIMRALVRRYELNFTRQDTSSSGFYAN
ncbi:unnamed protein product, partial [Ilex paraguariensis]